jgi:hypothetical protein
VVLQLDNEGLVHPVNLKFNLRGRAPGFAVLFRQVLKQTIVLVVNVLC